MLGLRQHQPPRAEMPKVVRLFQTIAIRSSPPPVSGGFLRRTHKCRFLLQSGRHIPSPGEDEQSTGRFGKGGNILQPLPRPQWQPFRLLPRPCGLAGPEQGRTQESFRLVEGWVSRQPNSADAKIELARLNEEFGDRNTAKETSCGSPLHSARQSPRAGRSGQDSRRIRPIRHKPWQIINRSLWYDNHQPQLASRVSALQTNMNPSIVPATPNNSLWPRHPQRPTTDNGQSRSRAFAIEIDIYSILLVRHCFAEAVLLARHGLKWNWYYCPCNASPMLSPPARVQSARNNLSSISWLTNLTAPSAVEKFVPVG